MCREMRTFMGRPNGYSSDWIAHFLRRRPMVNRQGGRAPPRPVLSVVPSGCMLSMASCPGVALASLTKTGSR